MWTRSDWSIAEDMQPGPTLIRPQPEITSRGRIWTQLTSFELNGVRAYTQLKIRDCNGDVLVDHGQIWPVITEDDGA
jgi:hypothetical protein